MGAGGDDLLDAQFLNEIHVALGHLLILILVPGAAQGIAAAFLVRAEDAEGDAGLVEYLCDGPGDFPVPVVKRGYASYPVEHIDFVLGRFLHIQPFSPLEPLCLTHAVRVEPRLQVLVKELHLRRHLAQGHGEVASHLNVLIKGGDRHRAVHLAGEARGTGPEGLFLDDLVDEAFFVFCAFGCSEPFFFEVLHELLRGEGLSGSGGQGTYPGTSRTWCMHRDRRSAST